MSSALPSTGATRAQRARLRGGWLLVVRALWIFYFIYGLANFVYQLPVAFRRLSDPTVVGEIEIPLDLYAWITVSLAVLAIAVASVVALIIFWRRAHDW